MQFNQIIFLLFRANFESYTHIQTGSLYTYIINYNFI